MKKNYIFFIATTEKNSPEALIFQLSEYKRGIIVTDIEVVYDPGGFLSAGLHPLSRRCHDWSHLKILMSVSYRELTSSCVSYTMCQKCHGDIEDDLILISLQYQNVHQDFSYNIWIHFAEKI